MTDCKKHILFLNGHLNVGGVEKSLVDLLHAIDYSKYRVDLLLTEGRGDYLQQVPQEVNVIYRDTTPAFGSIDQVVRNNLKSGKIGNICYRLISWSAQIFGKKVLRLWRPFFKIASRYDCTIAYRPGTCADIAAYVVRANKKICWWHHGEVSYTPQMIADANRVWRHFDNLVTVSNGCRDMLARHFTYPAEKIVVIPNIIDADKLVQMAGNASPYNDDKQYHFVTVSRLYVEKHIENVVLAAREMVSSGITDFCWYVVGDGDLYDDICRRIQENGMEECVKMLGSKSNPYPYIKFADVLVHTSYVESLCITILEAMALRTPCVVCRSIGPEGYMQDGVNGILVGQGAESLAHGLKRMLELLPNVQAMIENACQTVQEGFTPQVVCKEFESLVQ